MTYVDTYLSKPIEREYEGWIVQGMENYFATLGIHAEIWAVSPVDETTWPADEHLLNAGKIIGLQFKKATLDNSRIKWAFGNPSGQYDLIKKVPEIFYCLPTFINRKVHTEALHHCLFWRPQDTSAPAEKNAWYFNEEARTPYNSLGTEMRWGYFIEKLYSDENFGIEITSSQKVQDFLGKVKKKFYKIIPPLRNTNSDEASVEDEFYLLYVPFKRPLAIVEKPHLVDTPPSSSEHA